MKYVEPSVQPFNEEDLQTKIEHCYRICYLSEEKMQDNGGQFLKNILAKSGNKHYSPLEHARVQLKMDGRLASAVEAWQAARGTRFIDIDFWHKEECGSYIILVTGNLRSFRELTDEYNPNFDRKNTLESDLAVAQYGIAKELHKVVPAIIDEIERPDIIPESSEFRLNCYYLGEDKEYQTFHIVTCRDVLQQIARHRTLSLSVESTKFNNYTKKEFEFCIPRPYDWAEADWDQINSYHPTTVEFPNETLKTVVMAAHDAETNYCMLIRNGCKPQEARMVLPGGVKTELYLTGTFKQFKHFIQLRDENGVNPQCRLIAQLIKLSLDTDHKGWNK